MNSKRRAELQRKLSMGAVPRPPADLASRIKADIPQYLEAHTDRGRFTTSVAFTMRVAASILMLITTAFITLRLLEPETKMVASKGARPRLVPAVERHIASDTSNTTVAPAEPAANEVRLEIAQEISTPPSAPVAPPPQNAEARRDQERSNDFATEVQTREEKREPQAIVADMPDAMPPAQTDAVAESERMTITASAPQIAATEAVGSVTSAPAPTAPRLTARSRRDAAAAAPPMAAAPPVAAPEPAPVPPPSASPALVGVAQASELNLAPPKEIFGISVDPKAFAQMKSTLEAGRRPAAKNVNVDALVNYFAGPPTKTPRRLMLEVEASPVPIEATGDLALLRFTLDAPRIEVGPRASTPPAATDVSVEVAIEKDAVINYRRIGGTTEIDAEPTMLHNVSVTALYQLELKPSLEMRDRVATVRLRYRSLTDGRKHMITRIIRGADFAGSWSRASRRHRLASLGAIWSESLKGSGAKPKQDLARAEELAEELATQAPNDPRARELAIAASATAGGGKR